jgi:hypothetical protein
MANILKMHEQNTIQQLAASGWGVRRIAREMKIDRKTVRRYLNAASKSPTISTTGSLAPPEQNPPISTSGEVTGSDLVIQALKSGAGRPALCEKHRQLIEAKLDLGLTAQRIYQDLVIEALRAQVVPARAGSHLECQTTKSKNLRWRISTPKRDHFRIWVVPFEVTGDIRTSCPARV